MTEDDTVRRYDPDEWEDGLRCIDCMRPFIPGQRISERPLAMDTLDNGEPMITLEIICLPCALGLPLT